MATAATLVRRQILLLQHLHRAPRQQQQQHHRQRLLSSFPLTSQAPSADDDDGRRNYGAMKLGLATPFLAAASLSSSGSATTAAAFQVRPSSSSSRAFVRAPTVHFRSALVQRGARRGLASTAESLAEYDTASSPASDDGGARGDVLSVLSSPHGSLAVVRVCEEDLILPTAISASGVGVGGSDEGGMGSVPLAGEERVELADALFGSTGAAPGSASAQEKKGASSDGDMTGRTVNFDGSASPGVVVAHRHPVVFVLADSDSSPNAAGCSISQQKFSLDPASVPPGSVVDYMGRHVAVGDDGSVGGALPRAAADAGAAIPEIDFNGVSVDAMNMVGGGQMNKLQRPIFVPIPKISDIGLIDSPLVTGITAVDALTPIGKGQNMLLVGREAEGVDKREWAINMLRNVIGGNSGGGMRCYYSLTSADGNVRRSVRDSILEAGIQDDVVTVVSAHSSGSDESSAATEAAEAVAVAAAACTLGEHHALSTGGDAVVVIDDVNLHKELWDVTTRELVKVYGAEAVVEADLRGGSSSEMRGFFSGLIQRAARFNAKNGGGTVTLVLLSTLPSPEHAAADGEEAVFDESDFEGMSEKIKARIAMLVKAKVPLTAANLAKIQIPVPRPSASEDANRLALQHVEDLISMSDGQIWLDEKLALQGRSPPLDPSRSITRVGVGADTLTCRADAPALRSVVGSLRFEFQQAMDVVEEERGAGQLRRRDAFLLAMHQCPREVRRLSEECVALLAASRGHLDVVVAGGGAPGSDAGREALEGLLARVEGEAGDIMRSVDETLDLSPEDRNVLEETIASYFNQ